MPFRLSKKEAYEKWGIHLDPDFNISLLTQKQYGVISKYISDFPVYQNRKIGMTIISEDFDFDSLIVAMSIADKLFDKIHTAIRVLNISSIIIEYQRYNTSEEATGQLNNAIMSSDLVILNEISPVKYLEQQKLIVSHIFNLLISNRKPFLVTSNTPMKDMSENLGSVIMRLISTYTIGIDVKIRR